MSIFRMWLSRWGWLILALYLATFFVQKTNLVTSDLGRHLSNGREILQSHQVFETNYYSYTNPDFEAINHHWLFGVIIYLVYLIGGFDLLTVFNVLLSFLAFLLMINFSKKGSGNFATLAITLLLLPLLANRTEIRPETFSLLFSAIFYVALANFSKNKIRFKFLLPLLIFIQLIWVNSHLFFIFGSTITGYFWLKSFFAKNYSKFKQLSFLLFVLTLVWLINPAGITGAIEPFGILREYGYSVLENQPIWKLLKLWPQPIQFYLIFISVVFLMLQIWSLIKKKSKPMDFIFIFALTISTLYIFRLINFYAILILPPVAKSLNYFLDTYSQKIKKFWNTMIGTMVVSFSIFVFSIWLFGNNLLTPNIPSLGFGIYKNNNLSAEFFKQNDLSGPIFNNYDIGGYLIFNLYPKNRVFIDNRPEAYPEDFFTQEYIPAQLDENTWQKLLAKYNFNVIFFHRNDLTNWGQDFLIRIVKDENWVPVFVDNWTILFVSNSPQNQAIIKKYRLPAEMFRISTE